MLEMSIDSIRVSVVNSQRVVILKESQSDRYLPIWIGSAEADAIAIKLQGVSVPRPMTHDLLYSMITALGARINFILVNDLQNDTFYAKIYLNIDKYGNMSSASTATALCEAVKTNCIKKGDIVLLDAFGGGLVWGACVFKW